MNTLRLQIFLPLSLILLATIGQVFFGPPMGEPLRDFSSRPKLLRFGMYVTPNPNQNPIDPPERFTGYHTALDIETFPSEAGQDVPVFAICDGEILAAQTADGHGGVLIQRCLIKGESVTVLYGHVNPASFTRDEGSQVAKGDQVAVLGEARTEASGLNRKHLHLSIHRGSTIEYVGYVQTSKELQDFLDPLPLLQ
jgi:murein DD-endopeptidase MepM/ murein hydrolase activator NlpD